MGCDLYINTTKHELELTCYRCGKVITTDQNGRVIGHDACGHERNGEWVISCNIDTNGEFR